MEQLIAEILVKQGYAHKLPDEDSLLKHYVRIKDPGFGSRSGYRRENVQVFDDTLEGRRQADALIDYFDKLLCEGKVTFWTLACLKVKCPDGVFQYRIDCLKWCLEQLSKEEA